jgi:hypothetical protein
VSNANVLVTVADISINQPVTPDALYSVWDTATAAAAWDQRPCCLPSQEKFYHAYGPLIAGLVFMFRTHVVVAEYMAVGLISD